MAEYNRNICLAMAQIFWIALVGRADVVSGDWCTAFGALAHFAWLSTFCWTGNHLIKFKYICVRIINLLETLF